MLGDVAEPSPDVDLDVELRRRWSVVARDAGLDGAERLVDDLLGRYAEPHRHHHERRHLLEVLEAADELSEGATSVATRLAAWFHDAVYDGRAGADEAASAELARQELRQAGLDAATTEAVAAIVAATAGHLVPGDGPPVDPDTAVMLDADLAILSAEPDRYARYATGIRDEHPDVDDQAFRAGRQRALRTLIEREHLFHTAKGRATLEPQARENVARELAELSSDEGGG
jgi:predicted metal-dependent HD superfamily phosphohydrolase